MAWKFIGVHGQYTKLCPKALGNLRFWYYLENISGFFFFFVCLHDYSQYKGFADIPLPKKWMLRRIVSIKKGIGPTLDKTSCSLSGIFTQSRKCKLKSAEGLWPILQGAGNILKLIASKIMHKSVYIRSWFEFKVSLFPHQRLLWICFLLFTAFFFIAVFLKHFIAILITF